MDDRSDLELGLDFTFAYGRAACVSWMYPLHILTAYLLTAFGILAFICRVWERAKSWHGFFGRCFMYTMYWGYATSLMIHRFGLNYSTIIFMAFKLLALGIGYFSIRAYSPPRQKEAFERAFALAKNANLTAQEALSQAKHDMEMEKTTWASRIFSLKALHGITMAFAWFTMAGRVFSTTKPFEFDGCWTYPAYKTLEGEIEYLPRENPGYSFSGELTFGFGLVVGGLTAFTVIGSIYSYFAARKTRRLADAGLLHPSLNDGSSFAKKNVAYDSTSSSGSDGVPQRA